ncbi:hypothetical protein [Haladaptatus sp. CMAA 1911]|uniref:hypothetical protein n=1 Tax=unclassified Haladaptatus TaxID=2622732 RepID=UPI003754F50E
MKRRTLLASAAGTSVAITGCVSNLGRKSKNRGVVLTKLSIENDSRVSRTVAVKVIHDDTTILSSEYEAGPRRGDVLGGQVIEADFPTEPGDVAIRAEMGTERAAVDLADETGNGCSNVQIWIESNGTLAIFTSNEGTACFET